MHALESINLSDIPELSQFYYTNYTYLERKLIEWVDFV